MNLEISAWVDKAESDWRTMLRESVVVVDPSLDAVCYHAQQCTEKYLKARLILSDVPFYKTHDLLALFEDIIILEPHWEYLHDGLGDLNSYAVALRYPGLDATNEQAERSVELCRVVRKIVRLTLGLSSD